MIVSPRAASSQILAMLTPRISALINELSSNEPKNEPRAMRAPSHRCGTVGNGPRSRHLASPRPLRAWHLVDELQMTFLRTLPSGATRPSAEHFPLSG